jgi:organic hydroperoxide reductase OsmC/OhrA
VELVRLEPKRYRYETALRWTAGHRGVMSTPGKPEVEVACPPEFGGEAGHWSPEDLFVSSVNVCLMTTFLSIAERERIDLISYESGATGLATIAGGNLRFVEITVRPKIVVRDGRSRERSARALEKAPSLCMVTLSIKPEVVIDADIRLVPGP